MLGLIWQAYLKDGKIIKQFDDDAQTQEHKFQEVLDHQDNLAVFNLINVNSGRVYQVNLEHGRFHIFSPGFIDAPEAEVAGNAAQRYRLINFRRVTQNMSWNGKSMNNDSSSILYFLGYQYTTAEGKNVKQLLQINDRDEIYLI